MTTTISAQTLRIKHVREYFCPTCHKSRHDGAVATENVVLLTLVDLLLAYTYSQGGTKRQPTGSTVSLPFLLRFFAVFF